MSTLALSRALGKVAPFALTLTSIQGNIWTFLALATLVRTHTDSDGHTWESLEDADIELEVDNKTDKVTATDAPDWVTPEAAVAVAAEAMEWLESLKSADRWTIIDEAKKAGCYTGAWEVRKAERSERNGELYIHGLNHYTGDEFHWHIGLRHSMPSAYEYDFSDCEATPEAAPMVEAMIAARSV